MKEKDTLAQFIQGKLDESSFAYQPQYWEQAQAQMAVWEAEDRRKRRVLWWYSLGGLLLLVSSLLSLYAYWPPSPSLAQNALPVQQNSPSAQLPAAVNASTNIQSSAAAAAPAQPNGLARSAKANKSPQPDNTTRSFDPLSPSATSLTSLTETNEAVQTASQEVINRSSWQTYLHRIGQRTFGLTNYLSPPAGPAAVADKSSFIRSLHLFIETGASLPLQAPANESNRSIHGQSFAGLGLQLPLRAGISLESGLYYQNQSINGLQLSLTGTQYDFVAREQSVNWQVDRLHWLIVPLQINLRPLPRHAFSFGANWHYLLSTQGQLEETYSDPFSPTSSSKRSANGITYGLRTNLLSAQLGYRFYLQPRLALDLRYRHGLRNLLDASVWTTEAPRLDRQLQVGLLFYLK